MLYKHTLEQRQYWREKNHRKTARNRSIIEQVRQIGCYFCLESDYEVLEFAHIDKKKEVPCCRLSFTTLIKEIEKCEVLCPTCHKKFDLGKLQLRP